MVSKFSVHGVANEDERQEAVTWILAIYFCWNPSPLIQEDQLYSQFRMVCIANETVKKVETQILRFECVLQDREIILGCGIVPIMLM